MKNKTLAILWLVLYVICAALSVVTDFGTGGRILCCLAGLCFFVPAFLLLWRGKRTEDAKLIWTVRGISIASLVLTTATILSIFLSVNGTEKLGHFLQGVLVLVSAPMLCFEAWVVSLFLWACLLFWSFIGKKK